MSDVLNKVVDIVCEQLGADKGDVNLIHLLLKI